MKLLRSFQKIISKIFNSLAIFLIRCYQIVLSPILPPSCRHIPTCSNYALSAYKKYPFLDATFLSIRRILRCNPFFKGGYDPLPENFKLINFKTINARRNNG